MSALGIFYHAHPIVWTATTIGVAYVYGKVETEKALDRWREMHRKMFICQAREPHDR